MKKITTQNTIFKLLFLVILVFGTTLSFSQEDKKTYEGKVYGDLFLNSNYNIEKEFASVRLNRLHFGYKKQLSESLYFNGMFESALEAYDPNTVGNDYNDITNLFEFCLGFKKNKIEGKVGLIGTELNQQQEKLWQHRYVDKVFSDKYGYAPTNDFGGLIIYKPTESFKIDASITNGEGHKNLQQDDQFRVATGLTYTIKEKIITRVYSDFLKPANAIQVNFTGIIGYKSDAFTLAGEYNHQLNNTGILDKDQNGISAYLIKPFAKKYEVFARYDMVMSNTEDGFTNNWNIANDGELIIAGVQYKLNPNVILAVDYRNWQPADVSISDMQSLLFVDVAVNF